MEKLISVTDAAKLLGITRAAVHLAISEGRLPATRIGNGWIIRDEDASAYVIRPGGKGKSRKQAEQVSPDTYDLATWQKSCASNHERSEASQ